MFSLFLSLGALGLSAVDPVGIAAMPVLLLQKRPLVRSAIFLAGSFVALVLMGVAFVYGLGSVVLQMTTNFNILIPIVEISASVVLFGLAIWLMWPRRIKKPTGELSQSVLRWLQLKQWQLFILGAIIVIIQSAVDVVFVIAMIQVGQLNLSMIEVIIAVMTYAFAALLIQLSIVIAYIMTPHHRRLTILDKTKKLSAQYSNRIVTIISVVFGLALLISGILSFTSTLRIA